MDDHSPQRRGDFNRESHDGCDICAAYALGRDHARATATWITDGNDSDESRRHKLADLENYDEAYLRAPNLSGEYADDMNPRRLYAEITGEEFDNLNCTLDETQLMDALCDAYEDGVSETFTDACIAELRKWLDAR